MSSVLIDLINFVYLSSKLIVLLYASTVSIFQYDAEGGIAYLM